MSDPMAKNYPDIISFAFWCRRSNIIKLKEEFDDKYIRLGRGVAFHIAPSNVPINFAFSYIFSLLAGNANIVRVSSKDFPQTNIICKAINKILADKKYRKIADMTSFIRYEQDDDITGGFSAKCDVRIIWGGDSTINNIRKLPIPEKSIEVAFTDKYSFCAISGSSILDLNDGELKKLAGSFYNDAYLMDQNACSSPHLVVWIGDDNILSKAKERFWASVFDIVSTKYELQSVNVVDKYTQVCQNGIDLDNINYFKSSENYIYRIGLRNLTKGVDTLRGKCGYFYEFDTDDLNKTAHIVTGRYQTLTYFGFDRSLLRDYVMSNTLTGIDRIVPIGTALDISVIWDGYDLVRTLSRICDIE